MAGLAVDIPGVVAQEEELPNARIATENPTKANAAFLANFNHEIRRLERLENSSPVPIIPLTADAMADDRDRCLDAVMNVAAIKPTHKKS